MKRVALVVLRLFLLSALFVFFHPKFSVFNITNRGFYDYFYVVTDYEPVAYTIKFDVEYRGLKRSLIDYGFIVPYQEEMWARGLVLLMCLFIGTKREWARYLVWGSLIAPTFFWALMHPYPPLYQGIIFFGGLINGACIIYMPDTKAYKALGMVCAVLLHGAANVFYVFLIINLA